MQLKKAQDATDEEIAEATFVTDADMKRRLRIIGLRELMLAVKRCRRFKHLFYSRRHSSKDRTKVQKSQQNRHGNVR